MLHPFETPGPARRFSFSRGVDAWFLDFDAGFNGARSLQFDAWRGLQRARPAESGRSGQQAGIARAAGARGWKSRIL
ncbi:MAG: hypothetical protein CMP07_02335 [Xanthomonadales bacterium]|nr:hypothetical protein [Xanthomonadales bacterium]